MQSKERYFILPNQSIDDIPNDIQHLYLCGSIGNNNESLYNPQPYMLDYSDPNMLSSSASFSHDLYNYDSFEMQCSPSFADPYQFCNFYVSSRELFPIKIISITSFYQLESITIGNNGLMDVREFVVDNLPFLESVIIGEHSFDNFYNNMDFCDYISEVHDDGICRITNCPNLRQLEIGDYSFQDFKSFELSNLNSLQSIKFGYRCFRFAGDFSLKGE